MTTTKEKKIPAGKFKSTCLALMDHVNKTGQVYIITKHGKATAKLSPIHPPTNAFFGCASGSAIILGDITQPLGESWNADQ